MSSESIARKSDGDSQRLATLLDICDITIDNQPYTTNYKFVLSGNHLDVFKYEDALWKNLKKIKDDPLSRTTSEILEAIAGVNKGIDVDDPVKIKANEKRKVSRARTNIMRLIQTNFVDVGKLITLTFKKTDKFDIKSLTDCNKRLPHFRSKLRKLFPDYRYISVPEFQKRGAVHYHMVMDLPYVPIEDLRKCWPYGFVKINKIFNTSKVAWYLSKYLSKNVNDSRFNGHRCYSRSNNIQKPKVFYGNHLEKALKYLSKLGIDPIYQKKLRSEWYGKITCESYNLCKEPVQESKDE